MNMIGYLILALAKILNLLIDIYTFVVAIAVLLSWVNPDPMNPVVRILRGLTEPIFWRIRRLLPRALLRTGIDFSPMILLFLLILIQTVVVQILYDFAQSFLS